MPQRARQIPFTSIAAALLFLAFWVVLSPAAIRASRAHDFLDLYRGANLAWQGEWAHLHQPGSSFSTAEEIVTPLFVRPSFYAALLAPMGALPFETAHILWLSFWAVCYCAASLWAARTFTPDHLVLGSLFMPAVMGIAHGEDCVLLLLVVIGSYILRRRPVVSGAILAAGLVKFHLFLLFPLLMAAGRRWGMLKGFSVAGAAVIVVSFVLSGVEGSRAYISLLLSGNPRVEPSPDQLLNLSSLLLNIGIGSGLVSAILWVAIFAVVFLCAWNAPDWRWYTAASAGSLLLMPHTYGYDATFLLLGLWLTVSCAQSAWTRAVAATLCTPLPWAAVIAGPPWGAVAPITLSLLVSGLAVEAVAERLTPGLPRYEETVGRDVLPVGDELAGHV